MIDAEKESKIKEQYNSAMKAYDEVDINSATFQTDITNAVAKLDDIGDDVLNSKTILKDMYDRAAKYEGNKEYEKAYFLFALLSYYDYEDSYSRANDCYYNGNYNYQ